jgi:type IV secretion system protein VirB6
MIRCPAFPIDGRVADMLRVVDCQTHNAVAEGYGRLFGAGGAFGAVLTAGLTLYVAFFAYRLLLGRGGLSLSVLTPRVLILGLVLTFATSWPAYQAMVFDLLTKGPEEIASVVIGGDAAAAHGFVAYLDKLFARLSEVAAQLAGDKEANVAAAGMLTPAAMIQHSAMILLFGTMGVLVVAKIVLAMLLAVGPIFILLALYAGARGLFEGWLRSAMLFALAPLLTILVGWAGLTMLSPIIAAITTPGAPVPPRLPMMLFAGSIIYAALLLVAFRTAVSVTAGWKLPGAATRESATNIPASGGASFMSSTSAERIDTVVAAVSRDDAMAAGSRAAPLAALPAAANDTAQTRQPLSASRTRGLGQTFRGRTPAPRQNLSGAFRT